MEQFWLPNLEYLKTVLKLNLSSVIDIAIVAFVMYKLMLLIKGTRAVQLLKGLAVLLIATFLSSLFNLYTMNWLLRQAMTALVVALPVVFQPELRRALEKLGRGQFLAQRTLLSGEIDQAKVIAEISRSATVLSKNKMGALIILERETGLEEHIGTGVRIDGVVSAEFMVNIFLPRTPLHDGAVIIRGDRVAAAACFLPLSDNPQLTTDLGTRHRAGLGITEQSDAVAVIISEETGVISLAVEGVLNRYLDETTLQDKLTSLLGKKTVNSLAQLWFRR
ncbi:MAG: DNA integrity scanning protein DisA [Firmicutes bacterium ADurb.Bin373]|nr:MAG: DNA integrity scanning protein DisA [Firmicutes bacterium ADurb.Bin373]